MRTAILALTFASCGGEIGGSRMHDASLDESRPDVLDASPYDAVCAPSGAPFAPWSMPSPSGAHQRRCEVTQLDLYHQCVIDQSVTACAQLMCDSCPALHSCIRCIATTDWESTWGPEVYEDGTGPNPYLRLNLEGCINLATGQSGPQSCGQRLFDFNQCQARACQAYQGTPTCWKECAPCWKECTAIARTGVCKTYGDTYALACSNLMSPDLVNCFQQQGETDLKPLRVRMNTYFCGP